MVIARNEETGISGVFPITALMSRQAADTMWITVEDAQGQITRMGVTSEHPLFVIGEGWLDASQVAPGDQIRNSNLQALTVLSIDVDTRPQIVHNLEIAEAHTYFAGELEAWGHNISKKTRNNIVTALMQFGAACGPAVDPLNGTKGQPVQSGGPGVPKLGGSLDPSTPPDRTPGPKFGSAGRDKKRNRRVANSGGSGWRY
ncbi:MAG: polymorphic toxin-type HINT domain-containing protein [Paracoccaceae bacterium]